MRLLLSALLGTMVAISLFLMMSGMISGAGGANERQSNLLNLDFIRRIRRVAVGTVKKSTATMSST